MRPLVRSALLLVALVTGGAGDPVAGRAIVADRQLSLCVLCHRVPVSVQLQGDIGPDLAGIGSRMDDDAIRSRVAHARQVNPGSVMPTYDGRGDATRVAADFQGRPILTEQQIDDVTAFLTTLRAP